MARNKKLEESDKTIRLTPELYWEWRTTIAEMELQKQKLENSTLHAKLLQKESEILNTKLQIFNLTKVQSLKDSVGMAQKEYDRMKSKIESSLGISLNNKMIDDVTFEVKDLPDSN